MILKPFYKDSAFWFSFILIVLDLVGTVAGYIPEPWGPCLATVTAAIYKAVRAYRASKAGPTDQQLNAQIEGVVHALLEKRRLAGMSAADGLHNAESAAAPAGPGPAPTPGP